MTTESTAAQPVRLQLSRKGGFNLQAHSTATNGLPAIVVIRPTRWGNPFVVGGFVWRDGRSAYWFPLKPAGDEPPFAGCTRIDIPDAATAVRLFEDYLSRRPAFRAEIRRHLKGHNLACTCRIGDFCHADVLLRICQEDDE